MAIPKFLAGLSANGKRVQNVADPSVASDAANKSYVDAVAAGRDWKESVRVASTGNITLSAPGATINGVTMAANDRVLLKNQTTGSENGIWVWNGAAAAMTRATDANTGTVLTPGATVAVEAGTVDADTRWTLTTDGAITVGTTTQTWTKDATGGGSTYVAGGGLTESPAGTFNVGAGTGMVVNADDVAINPAVVVRKFAANCAATTNPQTFAHGLGSGDVVVQVVEVGTPSSVVIADVTVDATNIIVDFGGAPTAGQYRVIAHV